VADTGPNSKRKRRRWIIVGVLLFSACALVWLCWPRENVHTDARFVGTWQFAPDNEVHDLYGLNLQLRESGEGILWNSSLPFAAQIFEWSVDGDKFRLLGVRKQTKNFTDLVENLTGRQLKRSFQFRILDVDARRIALEKVPLEKGPNETSLIRHSN